MIGLCLGLAGALMQGITRNRLASPSLFGVTAGAALERRMTRWMCCAIWRALSWAMKGVRATGVEVVCSTRRAVLSE